jgi:putative hydrolase
VDPVEALERIALLLIATGEPSFRARVFSRAASALKKLRPGELELLVAENRLRDVEGIGPVVERTIIEALGFGEPAYLQRLQREAEDRLSEPAGQLRQALRGDCHVHSDWSDGRAPIEEMAEAARALGHEYMALTDHSPRLTIAHGLTRERLLEQLDVLDDLNRQHAPFRILSGIECDILEDGALDQDEEVLARLDVVVGSVHSLLRMEAEKMTQRMVTALTNPHLDILGHCTGRIRTGRGRPESQFDADLVFETAAKHDKAVEINCRPERLDPPRRLLGLAAEKGCRFAINTDAHTVFELTWQLLGCDRAASFGIGPDRVVTAWSCDDVLAWTRSHERATAPR